MIYRIGLAVLALSMAALASPLSDTVFPQESAVRIHLAPELAGAQFKKLCLSIDDVPYVLTSKGVAREYNGVLALDKSFRPLAGKVATDITASPDGAVYYLYPDGWLSNDDAGRHQGRLPAGQFDQIAVGPSNQVVVAGPSGFALAQNDAWTRLDLNLKGSLRLMSASGRGIWLSDGSTVWNVTGKSAVVIGSTPGIQVLDGTGPEVVVSHGEGILALSNNAPALPQKLPVSSIRGLVHATGGWWAATSRGAFFAWDGTPSRWATPSAGSSAPAPSIRYFAGRRWLADDDVVGVSPDSTGTVWMLTRTCLQAVKYPGWTLAEKAAWFERKVRSRHIRFGLTAERRLPIAGDIASGEMIDTDNDGGWSCYWLASQAFRYAVTHEPQAKSWAWETFGALERLQMIHTNTGFPARTMERTGFKVSDTDRWNVAPDDRWEWKGTTSSDEIASHLFAYAVLWECAADSEPERDRIRNVVNRIATHILDHGLYLVDVDGKPTLWGRWHPEYLNAFPPAVFDRRLNSAEIIGLLQFAYRVTGSERFREKAVELLEKQGYRKNISLPMGKVDVSVVIHQGVELGDSWNHSDDELAFIAYWVLCRYALTPELKTEFVAAVNDHWQLERNERYPFWNFAAAGCGLQKYDPEGALWTLRGFPTDTVSWRVENSHRLDLTHLPKNFREQEMAELLPPGERQYVRCNTQPFILDGGDGGHTEFAGDEFLLGYWMGRFVGAIGGPVQP